MDDSGFSSSAAASQLEPPKKKKRLKNKNPPPRWQLHSDDHHVGGDAKSKPVDDDRKNHHHPPPLSSSSSTSSLPDGIATESTDNYYSDPFANYTLRCNSTIPKNQPPPMLLWWYSAAPPIQTRVEQGLLDDDLLLKYGRNERGMFRDKPEHVIAKLQKRTKRDKIPLLAALSLRRNHMKHMNPTRSMAQLRLGNEDDIRQSAQIFESVVERFLTAHNVTFYSEDEQKSYIRAHRKPGQPYPPTPDFLLRVPIQIQPYRINHHHRHRGGGGGQKHKLHKELMTVHWIEVKMFYGASTLPQDGKTGVGCLLQTAHKYVRLHGPGAMIFYYGFGDALQTQLANVGVLCLDAGGGGSSTTTTSTTNHATTGSPPPVLDPSPVQTHQRTWCADANGRILP
jgi:hypothetical protein